MLDRYMFSQKEIDGLVASMIVLIDTQEKKIDHITAMFDKYGIKWKRKKLAYGDYSFMIEKNDECGIPRNISFEKEIMIERKASLEELSNNLSNERDRFEKELALAPKTKIVLVENSLYYDVATGNYDTKYNKKSFLGTVHSFWFKYNCPFIFTGENTCTALFIRKFFEYYLKNTLVH